MAQQKVEILTEEGRRVTALAPVVVSASRATDIPAFYADWFFRRLEAGYVRWRNPFNGKDSYVSFQNTRFIVFWSKNPAPLIPYLSKLKERGIGCYVQYTLNDYEEEGLEPNVPSLQQRIDTFKKLVDILGPGSVVWRFDPMILTDKITIDNLLAKVQNLGDQLKGYAEKLVFSFADIASYKKVERNLQADGVNYMEWDKASMLEFAERLNRLNRERWNYLLATCAEDIPLEQFGITHNKCIDPALIRRLGPKDGNFQSYMLSARKDKGQRKACGCFEAKDIGAYTTCPHGCRYCYANTTASSATANFQRHQQNPLSDSII